MDDAIVIVQGPVPDLLLVAEHNLAVAAVVSVAIIAGVKVARRLRTPVLREALRLVPVHSCKMITNGGISLFIDIELIFIPNMKIVVEKLTKNVTENHVREIFGGFGDIEYLDVPINKACKACF